jgi:hypothetical protein
VDRPIDHPGRERQMIEIRNRWRSVGDKEKWAARGASFVAKAKATKVVWFPPKPVETGKKTVSSSEKATKGAAKKTTGAAKRTAGGTASGAKKATKKTTNPARRQKT